MVQSLWYITSANKIQQFHGTWAILRIGTPVTLAVQIIIKDIRMLRQSLMIILTLVKQCIKLFLQFLLMGRKLDITLQTVQIALFLMGRILDDLTWYDIGVPNEVDVFEGISVVCMILCVLIQIYRKHNVVGMWKILFVRSQFKFIIVWSLTITIVILFFNIFGCQKELPHDEQTYFYIQYTGCCLNVTQIALTILNYSLICNTRAERGELVVYEMVLFGEIIFEGNLILIFITSLTEKPKDYSILLISIMIANQVLMMDLVFRAAYEDRQREEIAEKEHLLKYKLRGPSSKNPVALNIELTNAFPSER